MEEQKLKDLNKRRGSIRQRLTVFEKYLQPLLDLTEVNNVKVNELRLRLSTVRELCSSFDDIQTQIELLVDDDSSELQMNERETTESRFYELIASGQALLEHFEKKNADESLSHKSNRTSVVKLKLPPIQIPSFEGDHGNWLSFRDTYLSLIHENEEIDNINKFHYLKQYLKGSASKVIDSLAVSSNNYDTAWSLLCERFDNKHMLVHEHIKCLFSIETLHKESEKGIRHIIDTLTKNLSALNSLGEPTDKWDSLIIYMASAKLDSFTARKWEESRSDKESPTLEDFFSFLRQRATVLETINATRSSGNTNTNKNKNEKQLLKSKSFIASSGELTPAGSCLSCKENHKLYECPRFKSLPLEQRITSVNQWNLCPNCLRGGHQSYKCRLFGCRICKKKHNTLLHKSHSFSHPQSSTVQGNLAENNTQLNNENMTTTDSNVNTTSSTAASGPVNTISMSAITANQAVLSTALVQVTNNGNIYTLRAILDSGSQSSFITERARNLVGCSKKQNYCQSVSGLGNTTFKLSEHCNLQISSLHSDFHISVKCYILPKITDKLPQASIRVNDLGIPNHIRLADPQFYNPSDIDLLLGADVFWDLIGSNRWSLGSQRPILQETHLGWIVAGPMNTNYYENNCNKISCNFSQEIREQLTRFWEIEEVPQIIKPEFQENCCERLFTETTQRDTNGRFCVQIPFKESPAVLGESHSIAEKRLMQLERKLKNKPQLKEDYQNFINEYERLGHMTEVSRPRFGCYLPHHAVIRESSETTKLRVVFDASSKTSSGISFNDIQHVGPVVQDDLFSILLRYRQYRYAISADVEKMYRQILVQPDLRYLQMILWRDEPSLPLKHYELNTVTYGTASAPYLSTRCLVQLSQDCNDEKISQLIKENFYVDDFLAGAETEKELSSMINSVTTVLNAACFPLRKFRTNSSMMIENQSNESSPKSFDPSSCQSSVLGLIWNPVKDMLQFPININCDTRATKRTILSNSAKLFDPLGLVSPTTIIPKIILQKLWLTKLDWDDPVDATIEKEWFKFVTELQQVSTIEIPRYVLVANAIRIELHSFSDASQVAYAAAVYLRSIDASGNVRTRLLCAKTKVAPVKTTTIPRLELCGALLSAQLSSKVLSALRLKIDDCFHWTDSTIVLGWLNSDPRDLKLFIANRVSQIQDLTSQSAWRHVPGETNPADLASRGVSPKLIKSSRLWWNGPSFLENDQFDWPKQIVTKNVFDLPERKTYSKNKTTTTLHTTETTLQTKSTSCTKINTKPIQATDLGEVVNFERFSRFTTLQRSMAYVLRFINNLRNKNTKSTGSLTTDELSSSLIMLVKLHQSNCFSKEINIILNNQILPVSSRILSLSPFVDERNILCVGGRIQNSPETYNKKHPMLLDSTHVFTKLLFAHYHKKYLHCGPQLLLSNIRNEFWPLRGKILAKSTINNCKICKIMKAKIINPIMGNLPAPRVTPSPPFHTSGVDFAGPYFIVDRKGRGGKTHKCYLCVFVCFATKALHLEVASDLSTNAFILCLRRFISRRGKPVTLYCDNGTNFVGTSNELATFLRSTNRDMSAFAADEGITFKFSPAYSPHFGGLWESAVKSAKHHIIRTLGSQHLTYEELSTLFSQIEAILNSRPLTPLSSDPNDLEPITPGHFLIGRSLTSLPSPCFTEVNPHRLDRYQRIEQMRQMFWERWRNEYLSELQQRTKWRTKQEGLREGELVVLKEDNLPPLKWRMGRILKLYAGPDGVHRVAEVKTSKGTVRRAVHRLCCLPNSTIISADQSTRTPAVVEGGQDV